MFNERSFQHEALGARNVACTEERGTPLILVHGVTRRWQCFLPITATLAQRWSLYGMDLRGHGASDRVKPDEYHVVDYIQDVALFLRDDLKEPAILYGHSLGGMVVAGVAAMVPELVQAIVMEDPPFASMGTDIKQTPFHGYFSELRRVARESGSLQEVATNLADVHFQSPQGKDVRLGDVRESTQLLFMARCLLQVDPNVFDPIVSSEWLQGFDLKATLEQIQCPALLLPADKSVGGMLTDAEAKIIEGTLDRCARARFRGTGHLIHWLEPEKLTRHVLSFLEAID